MMRLLLIPLLIIAGLAVRGVLLWISPIYSLPYDHHEYVRWSIKSAEEGLASVYRAPPRESQLFFWDTMRAERVVHDEPHVCNYPPLAVVLFDLQGRVLAEFDELRVSNTRLARLLFSVLPMAADIIAALGAMALARRLAGKQAGIVALAAVVLAPPLMIDSAFWGQTDSWFLAPAVWIVFAMCSGRWMLAGLLFGLALSLKTQGVLLAPVWLAALIWSPQRFRIFLSATIAAAVLFVAAVPFTIADGFLWFRRAFLENVSTNFIQTTLKAFNVWYVDLLLCENDDASMKLLGLTKDLWGKLLLTAGLLACAVLVHRRYRGLAWRLTDWAGVSLLLAVMLPTRVHERYIVMCLPFLIAIAAVRPRVWWGLAPLLVAATFQITVYQWVGPHTAAGWWPEALQRGLASYDEAYARTPPEYRGQLPLRDEVPGIEWENYLRQRAPLVPYEWALTVGSLLAAALTLAMIFTGPRSAPPAPADPPPGTG